LHILRKSLLEKLTPRGVLQQVLGRTSWSLLLDLIQRRPITYVPKEDVHEEDEEDA
jgi:hypothetical protein